MNFKKSLVKLQSNIFLNLGYTLKM